jgi:hypothetical protein
MTHPFDPRITPWHIHEEDFYDIEDPRAQKEFLLRYAVLAPSGHNSQPWSFRITDEGVEVYADLSRRLPVCDPSDREMMMSIGASILNLRAAAAHFGFESTVLYQPSDEQNLPVAFVSLRETCDPDASLRKLFPAITRRHTNRTDFEKREIEPEALDRICEFVESTETVRFVPPHERVRAGELVEAADRELMADEKWRSELAEWVRPNASEHCDGIAGDAFGIPGPLSAFAPWLVRTVDMGESRGKHDRQLAEDAAGLVVITGDDDRASLLQAGETLEQLLLLLTSLGVQYAFLNQPVEIATHRRELWTLMRTPKPPQILLRIGYARPVKLAMPRRPAQSVTV